MYLHPSLRMHALQTILSKLKQCLIIQLGGQDILLISIAAPFVMLSLPIFIALLFCSSRPGSTWPWLHHRVCTCAAALLNFIGHALLPAAPKYKNVNPSDALYPLSPFNQSLIRTEHASRQIADCRHYFKCCFACHSICSHSCYMTTSSDKHHWMLLALHAGTPQGWGKL